MSENIDLYTKDVLAWGKGLYLSGRPGRIISRATRTDGTSVVHFEMDSAEAVMNWSDKKHDLFIGWKDGQFAGGACSCPHFLEMSAYHSVGDDLDVALLRGHVICRHLAWASFHLANGAPETGRVGNRNRTG